MALSSNEAASFLLHIEKGNVCSNIGNIFQNELKVLFLDISTQYSHSV